MNRTRKPRQRGGDSYGMTISDLMAGLVFVFIVMVIMFAVKVTDIIKKKNAVLSEHEEINAARTNLLDDLATSLKQHGVKVTIDPDDGVLRLPEEVLFATGQATLSTEGKQAIAVLAERLAALLTCKNDDNSQLCRDGFPKVEGIFVEGHSDERPLRGAIKRQYTSNLNLSAQRAINTYRLMEDRVDDLKNRYGKHLFSISGYGADRPVAEKPQGFYQLAQQEMEIWYAKNRRIDIRFLMNKPQILLDDAI